jgi:hypothetical protein
MPLIKTYRWDECDGVAGSSLGRGLCILGSITEEKVNWPGRRMSELCQSCRIRPQHETCDHPLEFAIIHSSLLHDFVLSFVPGVGCVEFVVYLLFLTRDQRLPYLS